MNIKSSTVSFRHSLVNNLAKVIAPKLYDDFRFAKHLHSYGFTVPQLIYLCQCLDKTKTLKGAIAEIGAYEGRTTVFLNKYMSAQKIHKKYYALDTFSGFTATDIQYEVSNRKKDPSLYMGLKASKTAFDSVMKRNGVKRVISIQADVNEYALKSLGPLCFALLDVDLYRPIKKSLKELYEQLTPNGIIVVDDCDDKDIAWDGADQAYKEFMQEIHQPVEIVHEKLGIIRKKQL